MGAAHYPGSKFITGPLSEGLSFPGVRKGFQPTRQKPLFSSTREQLQILTDAEALVVPDGN